MKASVRLSLSLFLLLALVSHSSALDLEQLVTNGTIDDLAKYVNSVGINAAKSATGEPVIATAARFGKTDMVKYLLENGADPRLPYDDGQTALLTGCGPNANYDLVKLLIQAGSNANAATSYGNTPLSMLLAYNGLSHRRDVDQIAELLLESGANVNGVMSSGYGSYDGYRFLQYAIVTNNPELLKLLVDHNADVSVLDQEGNTAIVLAAKSATYASLALDIVNILLPLKVDPNKTNKKGVTALTACIDSLRSTNDEGTRARGVKIMSLLIANGADPNLGGAMMLAAFTDQDDVVELLAKSGANVDLQDVNGHTALMYAAYNLRNKALESLIMLGAHVNIKDKDGKTALRLLKERNLGSEHIGKDRALELLTNAGAME